MGYDASFLDGGKKKRILRGDAVVSASDDGSYRVEIAGRVFDVSPPTGDGSATGDKWRATTLFLHNKSKSLVRKEQKGQIVSELADIVCAKTGIARNKRRSR